MLRDRDPGDETAHVSDFHFYTGAPVPRLTPATVDDREADYGRPHSVEDAFDVPYMVRDDHVSQWLEKSGPAAWCDADRVVYIGPWGAFPA